MSRKIFEKMTPVQKNKIVLETFIPGYIPHNKKLELINTIISEWRYYKLIGCNR